MSARHMRIVSLWVRAGQEAAFEEFEQNAATIMAGHGGRIDVAVRLAPTPDGPFEIHVVSFPDASAFEAYRADPAARELAPRRDLIITRTESVAGVEVGPYRS